MQPLEQCRPGCSSGASAHATTQPEVAEGEKPLVVTVTVCNLAGDVLLRDVDLSMGLNLSVAEFVRRLLDHMTPAPPGLFYAFTSSCFRQALVEHQVDPIHGLTRSSAEALHHVCVQPLYDGARLELQVVTVSSELETARREERESYTHIMEKAGTERVYLAGRHLRASFGSYKEASSHWEDLQNDLDLVRKDASDRLENELSSAKYICPYAGKCMCPFDSVFHLQEELQEHLYMVHRNDRIALRWGLA